MFSTLVAVGVLLGLFAVSLSLWSVLLRVGLRWAKIEPASWRRVLSAALLVHFGNVAADILLRVMASDSEETLAMVSLIALVMVPVSIISVVFRTEFSTAFKAWLPTALQSGAMIALAFFGIRPFLFEAYSQPSNSMAPTIRGNHWRTVCSECGATAVSLVGQGNPDHGIHLSAICENFHLTEYRTAVMPPEAGDRFLVSKLMEPERWDIVAFQYPTDPSVKYVKRIVGMPGEEIRIEGGAVWADGRKLDIPESLQGISYHLDMPSHWSLPVSGSSSNPAQLADDEYFVLGDFTVHSNDSRVWHEGAPGHNRFALPASHVEGVVTHIFWPPDRFRILK